MKSKAGNKYKKGMSNGESLHEMVPQTSGGNKPTKGYDDYSYQANGPGGHKFSGGTSQASKQMSGGAATNDGVDLSTGYKVLEKNAGEKATKDHGGGEYMYRPGETRNDSDTEMKVSKKGK